MALLLRKILFAILFAGVIFCSHSILNDNRLDSAEKSSIQISVDAGEITGSLPHIWNGFLGNLNLTITPQGERLLQRIKETSQFPFYRGCYGVTCSGIGHSREYGCTNVYHEDENGNPFYDFTLFDQLFDIMVAKNFVPMMWVGYMPEDLSSAPASEKNYDEILTYPPKDYDKWYGFINAMVTHCIDRYGRKTAAKWIWELGSEPDLLNHWQGTQEEYFKLYDYTSAAVKDALPEAMVGGIAVTHSRTRGLPFLKKFIDHCLNGKNYRDPSLVGAPLDFLSFHVKGLGNPWYKIGNFTSERLTRNVKGASPDLEFLLKDSREFLYEISQIKGTDGLPVFLSECDVDIGVTIGLYENPNVEYRNTEYHPAFQCALSKEMLDIKRDYPSNPIECIMIDSFIFPGGRIFEGQRSFFTAGDIDKPIFNSFRVLGKLGTKRLKFECFDKGSVNGLAARSEDNSIQVMVYNFNQEIDYAETREVELSVVIPEKKPYKLKHYRIDGQHSNAYSVWKSMEKPLVPDVNQMRILKGKMGLETYEPEKRIYKDNGKITMTLELPPHSVSLLVFEPID